MNNVIDDLDISLENLEKLFGDGILCEYDLGYGPCNKAAEWLLACVNADCPMQFSLCDDHGAGYIKYGDLAAENGSTVRCDICHSTMPKDPRKYVRKI